MKRHRSLRHAVLLLASVSAMSFPVSAQSFGISGGAGMSFPIQDFGDLYASGPAVNVTAEYAIFGAISLTLSTGYDRWTIGDGVGGRLLADAGHAGTLTLDGHIRNIPILIGVRYYNLGAFGDSFLALSTGSFFMRGTADAQYLDPRVSVPLRTNISENWSSTGFRIEAGTSYLLDQSWSVLVTLSYTRIIDLDHEIIPPSGGIPVGSKPGQGNMISATIGLQYR